MSRKSKERRKRNAQPQESAPRSQRESLGRDERVVAAVVIGALLDAITFGALETT